MLAGGTSAGNVVMWKWIGERVDKPPDRALEGPDKWEVLTTSVIAGPAAQLQVGFFIFHEWINIYDDTAQNSNTYIHAYIHTSLDYRLIFRYGLLSEK